MYHVFIALRGCDTAELLKSGALLLAACCAFLAPRVSQAQAESTTTQPDVVRFVLAPPDGTVINVRERKIVRRNLGGKVEEDQPVESSYVMVHRTTKQGFEIKIKSAV